MIIKDLGSAVVSVWDGLRPITKRMLAGALSSDSGSIAVSPQKFSYDAHADWELSRLLTALDERSKTAANEDPARLEDIAELAETCVRVLESQSASAEVFILLAERALKKHDYNKLEKLADQLQQRFSPAEIAEIVRQTHLPQIRAIGYETLALLHESQLATLLDDPLYSDIAVSALEQKAYEYESEEARNILELYFSDDGSEQESE